MQLKTSLRNARIKNKQPFSLKIRISKQNSPVNKNFYSCETFQLNPKKIGHKNIFISESCIIGSFNV